MTDKVIKDTLPDWSRVERVLLVRLRSIGDTVLMTPCLEALKSFRPEINISVLSEPLAAPLLEDHPLADELIIAPARFTSRARVIRDLRRRRFDVAFNMHGGPTATFFAALAGARHSAGYGDYRYSSLLSLRAPAPDVILNRKTLHSVEQQLALLRWTGVPWPAARPRLSLAVSAEASASVTRRLAALDHFSVDRFAVVAPAAAFESKMWSASGFAAVADHLSERWNLPAVIIAGPGQEAVAERVARESRARPQVLTGLSLKELTALIDRAQVFVGNDSGPMHIAAALARPVVAVFGPSSATVWHPWTASFSRVIEAGPPNSIKEVPPSRVISATDEALESALAADSVVRR